MSEVFLDPCFIFEINVSSQSVLRDGYYIYIHVYMCNIFSEVIQYKPCSRKMFYACVSLHFPRSLYGKRDTPGDRGGSLKDAGFGP